MPVHVEPMCRTEMRVVSRERKPSPKPPPWKHVFAKRRVPSWSSPLEAVEAPWEAADPGE